MEGAYTEKLPMRICDVNVHRTLRISRLFELIQEASIVQTAELGCPNSLTLGRGFLWMITRQSISITRMPTYDETVELTTWPGDTKHVVYPRYYRITDASGDELVRGAALWSLVSATERRVVFPRETGVIVKGVDLPGVKNPELPKGISAVACEHKADYRVPFSACDLNGHMNNTSYFNVADDLMSFAHEGRTPTSIAISYMAECRMDEALVLRWHEDDEGAFFAGSSANVAEDSENKDHFRIKYTW